MTLTPDIQRSLTARVVSLERYQLELAVPQGRLPLVVRIRGGLGEARHAMIGAGNYVWREPDEPLDVFEERVIDLAAEAGETCIIGGLPPQGETP
jgi:hypothetical protein